MALDEVLLLTLRAVESQRLEERPGDSFTIASTIEEMDSAGRDPVLCLLLNASTGTLTPSVLHRGQRLSTFESRFHVDDAAHFTIASRSLLKEAGMEAGDGRARRLTRRDSQRMVAKLRENGDFDAWYANVLEQYSAPISFSEHGRQIVRQQADATRTALQIGGFDSSDVHQLIDEPRAPFLRDLEGGARALEDAVIISDWSAFRDFPEIAPVHAAVKAYAAPDGRQVTIVYVNRTNIESSTGVDLIYHREKPASYLLVQYKMYEGAGDSARAALDKQFLKELNLMQKLDRESLKHSNSSCGEPLGYRLSALACYVKFCYRKATFDRLESRLMSGDVVPAEHLSNLASPGLVKSISPKQVAPSRFTASQFIDVATTGLFGTCGDLTKRLDDFVTESLKRGRRAVLALESG